jgi:anti-anti-sigma regulatory factor
MSSTQHGENGVRHQAEGRLTPFPTQRPASVLSPSGELTIFEASAFHGDLVKLLGVEGPRTLDLSGVPRMDAAGIQLVLAARRSGRVTVTGLTPDARRAIASLGCSVETDAP